MADVEADVSVWINDNKGYWLIDIQLSDQPANECLLFVCIENCLLKVVQ